MKKNKWLEYFRYSFEPDEVFYNEMVIQIPHLFEKLLSRKIDWDKVWLFVEPINRNEILKLKEDIQCRKYISMICSFENKRTEKSIKGNLAWYIENKDQEPFKALKSGNKLVFFLENFERYRDWFHNIPEMPLDEKQKEYSVLFDWNNISVKYETIGHEGLYYIILNGIAIEGVENQILEALNSYRQSWNKLSKERDLGLFHIIMFDNFDEEENHYIFHYDMGSSNLDSHKYILGHLIDSDFDVKEILIDTL